MMDVGWEGVAFIWFCFLWPAALVLIYKIRIEKKDFKINGLLALVVSYVVYFIFSYIPTIPLWVMGVDGFIESVGAKNGKYVILSMFAVAMLCATALVLFIFRKMKKQHAT